jgi:hypothetical protein
MLASPASAEEFAGRVVGVSDGDTVKVLREPKETVKVGVHPAPLRNFTLGTAILGGFRPVSGLFSP